MASTLRFPQDLTRIKSMSKGLILALLASAVVLPCQAQRWGGGRGFGPGGRAGFRGERGFFLGNPFWYADYPLGPLTYQAPSPTVVVIPSPAANSASDTKPEPTSEPLLIEWQGDHYARFGGVARAAGTGSPDYAEPAAGTPMQTMKPASSGAPIKSATLPPAILIFRDGHREQVWDYAIVGGVMYARGDYWRDGYWTKTVQLSALDVPATMSANEASSVKFVLPAGPNEVVTRP